jgi:hypothetical protein
VIARGLAIVALAACGDNAVAIDPPIDAAIAVADSRVDPPCAAVFSDNFAETWAGPANCATLATADGHTTLQLVIPSQTIAAPFTIAIDLGSAPGPGTYTAQSLATPWQADALHELAMTSCLYHAGTAAVPPGTFTLTLDALDRTAPPFGGADGQRQALAVEAHAHGTLDLVLYVLARPFTYCGETNIERLGVRF